MREFTEKVIQWIENQPENAELKEQLDLEAQLQEEPATQEVPIEDFLDETHNMADTATPNTPIPDATTPAAATPDTDSMPPPPRRSSHPTIEDTSEPVLHKRSYEDFDEFMVGFSLWCHNSNISRQEYKGLVEVLSLITDPAQIRRLPKDVGTLKRRGIAQLPLLPQRRKEISLLPEKLPTYTPSQKAANIPLTPTGWLYWIDPVVLVTIILSPPLITSRLHFDMAHIVDKPSEFYHGACWASSIRATCGKYAKGRGNKPVFPSDFVQYLCRLKGCNCTQEKPHYGRILSVAKDFSSKAISQGAITLQIQRIITTSQAIHYCPNSKEKPATPLNKHDLVLVEDYINRILEGDIILVVSNIILDRKLGSGSPWTRNGIDSTTASHQMGWKLRLQDELRPAFMSHPPRAELELQVFGRTISST